jgi:hypothetical protein
MALYPTFVVFYQPPATSDVGLPAVTLPSVAGLFSCRHYVSKALLNVKYLYRLSAEPSSDVV